LPGGTYHLGNAGGVAAELHAPFLDVGTGDVQFVAGQPLCIIQDPDYLDIVLEGVAEDIGYDRRIESSQYREFFGDERPDAYVLEPNGVEHPRGGLAEPGRRSAFNRFAGKAFGDEAAEAIEVYEVGEFEAVTKRSAGRENRIPKAQRADVYAEVDGDRGSHFAQEDTTNRLAELSVT